jgi:hypothetical protein
MHQVNTFTWKQNDKNVYNLLEIDPDTFQIEAHNGRVTINITLDQIAFHDGTPLLHHYKKFITPSLIHYFESRVLFKFEHCIHNMIDKSPTFYMDVGVSSSDITFLTTPLCITSTKYIDTLLNMITYKSVFEVTDKYSSYIETSIVRNRESFTESILNNSEFAHTVTVESHEKAYKMPFYFIYLFQKIPVYNPLLKLELYKKSNILFVLHHILNSKYPSITYLVEDDDFVRNVHEISDICCVLGLTILEEYFNEILDIPTITYAKKTTITCV